MRCIKDEMIQRFIDKEISGEDAALIEKHLALCSRCAEKVRNRQRVSDSVKDVINIMGNKSTDIPVFIPPAGSGKRGLVTPLRVICVAAASILLFIVLINPLKILSDSNENIVEFCIRPDVDANLPVSELQMEISIIDANGVVTEFITE